MQHIRAKDTSIEVRLRKALLNKGYRCRKKYNNRKMVSGNNELFE